MASKFRPWRSALFVATVFVCNATPAEATVAFESAVRSLQTNAFSAQGGDPKQIFVSNVGGLTAGFSESLSSFAADDFGSTATAIGTLSTTPLTQSGFRSIAQLRGQAGPNGCCGQATAFADFSQFFSVDSPIFYLFHGRLFNSNPGSSIQASLGHSTDPFETLILGNLAFAEAGVLDVGDYSLGVSAGTGASGPGETAVARWNVALEFSATPFTGLTVDSPIGPVNDSAPFLFVFPVVTGVPVWFDPEIAVGFDFESNDPSLNFLSVEIPFSYGDGLFQLFLFDEGLGTYVESGTTLHSGQTFAFDSLGFTDGLNRFGIRGIERSAQVDANDPFGFVTGLSFNKDGTADFVMRATVVPLPTSAILFSSALGILGYLGRRLSYRNAVIRRRQNWEALRA